MILTTLAVLAALVTGDGNPVVHPAERAFAEYWERIATNDSPPLVFTVDRSVSSSGNDAYAISERDGTLTFVGANDRSLWYAVYDFFGRHGCRWFWDGDRLPERGLVDVRGTAIREESRFEYRGIRYFAHRGLHRFQAEHWGLADWKREIDWCVKNRLNVVMLRIGMDDTWQKAFPEVVKYPDPAKPLPEALKGYDNRSLFWSLEDRGRLRKELTDYAVQRGLEIPTDFGTVSHWYSRTPKSFLAAKHPPYMPQASDSYGEETGRVWDIREPGWLDEYWKLTEAQIAAGYGGTNLLHTIGFGERRVFKERDENLKLKIAVNKQLVAKALEKYPHAKVLLAGWDFYYSWKPDEVRELIPQLDPKTTILWDYEADAPGEKNFTNWDVVGKFPYTFSVFLTYEMGLDVRANYRLIEERFAFAKNDPMCKGFIFWPESAHTDTLLLSYFAANAWRPDGIALDRRIDTFCRDRYGRQAEPMAAAWKEVVPISSLLGYWGNAPMILVGSSADTGWIREQVFGIAGREADTSRVASAAPLFARLAALDLSDPMTCRDAVDLARTALDRRLLLAQVRLHEAYVAATNAPAGSVRGNEAGGKVRAEAARLERLWQLFADLLAQHEDYSMAGSLDRLRQTAFVANKDFWKVLLDNSCNVYCRSHQYELVAAWCLPFVHELAETYRAALAPNGKPVDNARLTARAEALRQALFEKTGFAEMTHATRRPRTAANLAAVLRTLAEELAE